MSVRNVGGIKSMGPSRALTLQYYTAKNGKDYYREFLDTLDGQTSTKVQAQVTKLAVGIGNVKTLANKLWELKIDLGPGYRIFFTRRGNEIVLVLAGSDKSEQGRIIRLARRLLIEIEEIEREKK
jgi:putative addiction module killer protein